MKRICGLFILIAMLTAPSMAFAAEQLGIYVAPKFIGGWMLMDSMKLNANDNDGWSSYSKSLGDKSKGVVGGALAIGYDFNRQFNVPVRAEIEYAAFSEIEGKKSGTFSLSDGRDIYELGWSTKQKIQAQTLFLNAYVDFHNSTAFTPYVGAGIGVAFLNTKGRVKGSLYDFDLSESVSSGSKTVSNFAWNIGAGLGYDITENFTLDLGYRFAGLGEAKTKWMSDEGDNFKVRLKTEDVYMHQVALGLRMTF